MGVGSGEAAQLMIAEESTYGTAVTVTRSFEFVSESMKLKVERLESKGLRAGQRVMKSTKWQPGKRSASGDILMELGNIGFGVWLKHMMGHIGTTGAGPVYVHTASPDDLPTSLTVQIGKPSIDGTVQPFTYSGVRIPSWELSLKAGEIVQLKASLSAQDETTATGLATFSDPAVVPLTYVGGTLQIAASQVDVLDFSLKGNNQLDSGRFRIRNAATPKQQLENNWREYTGQINADFESLTQYNHYVNADEVALSMVFAGGAIAGGGGSKYQLAITANIRFDGDTPNVGGPAMLTQPLPFKCIASSSSDSSAISMAYQTTDATP